MSINFDYPDPNKVFGLSTSHWTKIVDWEKAKANGIKFAIIKAQNGINPVQYWKENYEEAKKAGILVGAYTWLYPQSVVSPGTQARTFVNLLKSYPTDIRPCVDYEWTAGGNPDLGDLWGFAKPFEDLTGKKSMIYSAPGYWADYGTNNPMWSDYPFWQAQYDQGAFDLVKPWNKWDFLQFTQQGKGVDYGVPLDGEIACELNYWRGTYQELLDFCTGNEIPQNGGTMLTGKVSATSLNIREGASTLFASLGKLLQFDVVEADARSGQWWHLTKITRNGSDVPLPGTECWASGDYITILSETPTPTAGDVHVEVDVASGGTVVVSVNGDLYKKQ